MINIALDIDGTIDENPAFFSLLTNCLKDSAVIHIVTFRPKSYQFETIKQLQEFGIHYNHLVFVDNKAEYIIKNNITVFFDDMDEFILDVPSNVTVFKIRELGNFDFDQKKWLYDSKTGINLDAKENYYYGR